MNEHLDRAEKLRAYRTLVIVIAAVLAFALTMLGAMIPAKTTAITVMLGAAGVFSLYLIVLCLRLIKELKDRTEK